METSINERFRNLLFFLKMNATQFSNELGYENSEKISRLLRKTDKENKPSIDIIIDIANKFEKINIVWLLTGNGNMINEYYEKDTNDNDIVSESPTIYGKQNKIIEKLEKHLDRQEREIERLQKRIDELENK